MLAFVSGTHLPLYPGMTSRHNPVRDRSGFSIMEMLTVLVLIGLLAGLAQPSLAAYLARQKTRQALDHVVADVALTRMLAVRSGTETELAFTSATAYQIRQSNPVQSIKRVSLEADYRGVQIAAPTADGRLVFNSRGLLRDRGTGRIVATVAGAGDTVEITTTGRAYRAR